jgi:hypothetical protein
VVQGFNHAGEEIWYNDDHAVFQHVFCQYSQGKPEDESCSDSLYVFDPSAHMTYLGIGIIDQCDTPAYIPYAFPK